ncbi:MAG: type II toxin-antitoxin system VapC family toxin [Deltaproteobacteria bacterium]|nr:type II toxin-antitoxin system VapC family toxin [Deltaproteobacteria bacterium]
MIIADTDVLIDFLRDYQPIADRIALEISSGSFATTVITAFELNSGAHSARQKHAVTCLLDALNIIVLDHNASTIAAKIRVDLESRGDGIVMADYLIAGICLSQKASLFTRNIKNFNRIPNLKLVTP